MPTAPRKFTHEVVNSGFGELKDLVLGQFIDERNAMEFAKHRSGLYPTAIYFVRPAEKEATYPTFQAGRRVE